MRTLVLASAALLALACTPARAASANATLSGGGLVVDSPCAQHVTITPDPGLRGQVNVQAQAEHEEEIAQLRLESRGDARVGVRPGGCWSPAQWGFHRTLTIEIRVPMGFPLMIDESGAGSYTIEAVGGPLAVDVSGAGDVAAAAVTTLKLDLSGAGQIDVGQADGAASIEISGHGKVKVGRAKMPSLSADISGAGSLGVASGQIGSVKLQESGAGSIDLGASVENASVEISGVGSVHFAEVNGSLHKEVSGLGSISVGN